MSLLAVKQYAVTVCLTTSDQVGELTEWSNGIAALRQLPDRQRLGARTVAALGNIENTSEKRLSGARGNGQKMVTYTIPVFLHAVSNDPQSGGDGFDTFVNLVLKAFRGCATGMWISDPVTNEQSQLFSIGEDIDLRRYEPVLFRQGESRLRFMAELELQIQEIVTG